MNQNKVSILNVQQAKEEGRKLVMVTAYDYPFGLMADQAGVDIVSWWAIRWVWWSWDWKAPWRLPWNI